MNERIELQRSRKPVEIQTITIAVIALFLFLITGWIVSTINNFIPANTTTVAVLIKLIAAAVATMAVYSSWIRNTRIHYFIEDNSLIIQNGGIVGRKAQEIITPKQAPKIVSSRTFLGNKLGYGDVHIEVDYFSKKTVYELKYIINPEDAIKQLRARLK